MANVTTTSNRIDHNPDGIQTVFPYNFEVDDAAWMLVYADGILYESNPFTVSGVGVPAGGEVTFQDPPDASIVTLTLLREVPLTQEIVYPVFGPFPAKTHEKALDKLTWISQQQEEELNRALIAPVDTDVSGFQLAASQVDVDDSAFTIKGDSQQLLDAAFDTQIETNKDDISDNAQGISDHASATGTAVHGLGTASTKDTTTSLKDFTVGNVLRVGDWGLGGDALLETDSSVTGASGFYHVSGSTNVPYDGEWHIYRNQRQGTGFKAQIAVNRDTNETWTQVEVSGSWGPWVKLLNQGDTTSSTTDETVGKLLKVGDFGLGSTDSIYAPDVNDITASGIYHCEHGDPNIPAGFGDHMILHMNREVGEAVQRSISTFNAGSFILHTRRQNGSVWGDWIADGRTQDVSGGYWVKYADGSLVMSIRQQFLGVQPANTSKLSTLVYPNFTDFIEPPVVMATVETTTPHLINCSVGVATAFSCPIYLGTSIEITTTINVYCVLHGKWY